MRPRHLPLFLLVLLAAASCEREARRYLETPAGVPPPGWTKVSGLEPGLPPAGDAASSPYRENAWGIAEGKRLYSAFNCNGCHAQGGGGIGPALMDAKWIYGSQPDQIYSTVSEGRPNGMPAFGRMIPSQQIWQLVAYVQTLGMQVPRDAAPGRSDGLNGIKPELRLERVSPRLTGHR
jgi:cytochrome c oxidase cbb3-type subunit 3